MESDNKERSRRIRVHIRQLLLEVWDPIEVRDEPFAQDEYDGYLGEIFALLNTRASDEELTLYLDTVAYEHMGLSRNDQSDAATRETVIALKKSSLKEATLIKFGPEKVRGL